MNWWVETGRFLIVAGIIVVAIGIIFLFGDKLPLGRLPGDVRISLLRGQFQIPVATCVFISLVITILLNVFSRK